jgi:hypothetical protein
MKLFLSGIKKKLKYATFFLLNRDLVVSLGGGCDIKLFLINTHYKYFPTEYFDYLWNLDMGLGYVKDIIKNDFEGLTKETDFTLITHKKFQKNLITKLKENEISLQSEELGIKHYVAHKYPELNFMHYPTIGGLVKSFNKKIKRFRKFLKSRNVCFVYYRQFDEPVQSEYINNSDYNLDSKIDFWIKESVDFIEFAESINERNKLLSLFALPYDFDKTELEKYNLDEKSKNNLTLDFIFYKNAESSERTYVDAEMKRVYEKNLAYPYLN